MSDKLNLDIFPSSKIEALAILYLQKQDLSEISPEELAEKYEETVSKIRASFRLISKSKQSSN